MSVSMYQKFWSADDVRETGKTAIQNEMLAAAARFNDREPDEIVWRPVRRNGIEWQTTSPAHAEWWDVSMFWRTDG